jgi:hypothetical protein
MRRRSAGGDKRPGMSTWDHQQADKWVQKFLVLLAQRGHKPGFRYGKDLYLDMFEFFKRVSDAVGGTPMDVALGVAVSELTRREDLSS